YVVELVGKKKLKILSLLFRRLLLLVGLAGYLPAQGLSVRSAALPGVSGLAVAPAEMVVVVVNPPLAQVPSDLTSIRLQMQPRSSVRVNSLVLSVPVVKSDSLGLWAVIPANAPLGRADFTLTVGTTVAKGS